ncbi:MAG TPA: DUF1801 domain-containing protein [Xanthomonadaceae bacterium]|nr:DUF1801 domain-containing protein [Xanthomonadaceae bacterium]
MARKRASRSTRKPPEPADSHAVIQDWIDDVKPSLRPIVEHVDKQIRKAHSGLQYAIKWDKAWYGLPKQGWIIEVVAYLVSVNVVFHGGAKFDPPPPLGEGSRYIKLESVEDADSPEMRKWIKQAGTVPGWKA